MKTKSMIIGMAAVIALAACEKKKSEEPVPAGKAVNFTAGINAMKTKAAGTFWTDGDAIGITGETGGLKYTNIKYTTDANGKFAVADAAKTIYLQDADAATFTAYYPFAGTEEVAPGTDGKVVKTIAAADQTADAQTQIDYLWAMGTAQVGQAEVKFKFSHCMTQLKLKFKAGAGVTLSNMTYTLSGLKMAGSFNTLTGEAAADAAAGAADLKDIPVVFNNGGYSSSLILFPQLCATDPVLTVTLDKVSYTATLMVDPDQTTQQKELAAGTSYLYNVTLKKEGLLVEQTTIEDWNDGKGGNVDARI